MTSQLCGTFDAREERGLADRRAREAERLRRIKDPALYSKVDTAALDAQVAEKQAKKAADAAVRQAYDEERLQQDQQIAYLEQERLRVERQRLKDENDFRKTQQGRTLAREFDLSDPMKRRGELPARVGDQDGRLSVSGCQLFDGEDLSYAHRVKLQQEQLRQWSDELVSEKSAAKAQKDAEDAAYAASLLEMDDMKKQLESDAIAARGDTNVAVAEYQLAQATAKRERERAQQVSELGDNVAEIQGALASSTLTEDPSVGTSYIAAHRARPDHYKGMPFESQQAILQEQAAQRDYKSAATAQAKAEKVASDAELEHARRIGCYTDAQVAQTRAEVRASLKDENLRLAQEQRSTRAYMETKVFPNAITDDFFSQFNTTSR